MPGTIRPGALRAHRRDDGSAPRPDDGGRPGTAGPHGGSRRAGRTIASGAVDRLRAALDRWRDPLAAGALAAAAVADDLLAPPSPARPAPLRVLSFGSTLPVLIRRRRPLAVA